MCLRFKLLLIEHLDNIIKVVTKIVTDCTFSRKSVKPKVKNYELIHQVLQYKINFKTLLNTFIKQYCNNYY